jgi:hypothetical protein
MNPAGTVSIFEQPDEQPPLLPTVTSMKLRVGDGVTVVDTSTCSCDLLSNENTSNSTNPTIWLMRLITTTRFETAQVQSRARTSRGMQNEVACNLNESHKDGNPKENSNQSTVGHVKDGLNSSVDSGAGSAGLLDMGWACISLWSDGESDRTIADISIVQSHKSGCRPVDMSHKSGCRPVPLGDIKMT